MEIEGTYHVDASPDAVWAGMMSPELLQGCIPGCRQLDAVGEGEYAMKLTVGIGAVRGNFTGKVAITDMDEPRSFRLEAEGKRSGASVSGGGTITITPDGDGARLDVAGEAKVTGILARVGQRLVGSAARVMMDQFFGCARAKIEAGE